MAEPDFKLTVRVLGVDTLLKASQTVQDRAKAPFRTTQAGKLIARDFWKHMRGTFSTKGRKSYKWAPLSPAYAAYKSRVRPGRSLLVFDGDLKRSLTMGAKGSIFSAKARRLVLGSTVPYAVYHQDGTRRGGKTRMPARPLFVLTKGVAERWVDIVREEIFEGI